ncbi:hypothetical protein E2562_026143 [Oryza meyeriana var. granulata]|uniref:Uncharacterized protein n=1 Tax=Oryza meyeriana var. granulata TaxID=110450 RepID=A0A6G1FCN9_9ORYZ|nr:hypothetical protein E2562_026143 [Oryza meyeriana var. granulata]
MERGRGRRGRRVTMKKSRQHAAALGGGTMEYRGNLHGIGDRVFVQSRKGTLKHGKELTEEDRCRRWRLGAGEGKNSGAREVSGPWRGIADEWRSWAPVENGARGELRLRQGRPSRVFGGVGEVGDTVRQAVADPKNVLRVCRVHGYGMRAALGLRSGRVRSCWSLRLTGLVVTHGVDHFGIGTQ